MSGANRWGRGRGLACERSERRRHDERRARFQGSEPVVTGPVVTEFVVTELAGREA
jgi:hypothetical protein